MSFRRNSFLALFFLAPACSLYNSALLDKIEDDDGGDGDGDGDGDFLPFTGGSTSGGGPSTGGGTSGGASTGSNSGDGGGPGGDTGSGGDGPCEEPPDDFTGVSETLILDNFDTDWPMLNNTTPAWNGSWSTGADAGATGNLTPLAASLSAWAEGGYFPLCTGGKMALRVEATGSDEWGVSFDGKLIEPIEDVDLSEYQGVIFWARSDNSSRMKLSFAEAAEPDMGVEATVPPLAAVWTQYKVPFPGSVSANVAIVKIVGFNIPVDPQKKIDFMVDEISFYKD